MKKLDEIFDKLVSLRTEEAEKLGFRSYTDLAYLRMERCFGREEAESFRDAARRELVPLAEALYKRKAAEAGLRYPLDFADTLPRDPQGDPRAEPGKIRDAALTMLRELSPETAEFADRLLSAGAHAPARSILMGILAGDDLRLSEVARIADGFRATFGRNAAFHLGTVNDEATFSGRLAVAALVFEESAVAKAASSSRRSAKAAAKNRKNSESALAAADRFSDSEKTMWHDEDLDIPTYLRRNLTLDR